MYAILSNCATNSFIIKTGRNTIRQHSAAIMGVTKEVLREGNGSKPSKGQEVTVHCTGYGKNRDLTQKFWCKYNLGK